MASIKVKFRPSAVADREGAIYFQIIHERKVRILTTDYHLFSSEWNEKRSMIIFNQTAERKASVLAIRESIRHDVERLYRIERKFCASCIPYSADDILDEFVRYNNEYTLFHFMESIIEQLRHKDKVRTSEIYKATLSNFRRFLSSHTCRYGICSESDIMLDSITSEIMESYEAWQKSRGIAPNTASFYMRVLRAVYNRAVDGDIIENRNPFKKVYTGVEKTVKRALPLTVIRQIKSLDLSRRHELDYARDMFLMSFYLRGMSFVDMAFLKKTDLRNGYVTYRRRKTGQLLVIAWTKEMQTILEKYPENKSRYLMPIIQRPDVNERSAYRNKGYNINHNLKKIAMQLGIAIPLTLYVARHSWASVAKAKGIPLSVISEGMGHDSETTTQIYLSSLDTSVVDHANSLILKSLM